MSDRGADDGPGDRRSADGSARDDRPSDDGVGDGASFDDTRFAERRHRSARTERPAPEPGSDAATVHGPRPTGWVGFAYDVLTSVVAVALVGVFLFTVSGVWPPLVAVQSGSMDPHMAKGDLVFVMEERRFSGAGAVADTGVVTAARGAETGYGKFQAPGDVIVFAPDGDRSSVPVIHRAMFWVERGERWVHRANPAYLDGEQCETDQDPATDTGVRNCPAPHAGFITKGDNNGQYDQVGSISTVVQPEWVIGTAEIRVPGLGFIRLGTS